MLTFATILFLHSSVLAGFANSHFNQVLGIVFKVDLFAPLRFHILQRKEKRKLVVLRNARVCAYLKRPIYT